MTCCNSFSFTNVTSPLSYQICCKLIPDYFISYKILPYLWEKGKAEIRAGDFRNHDIPFIILSGNRFHNLKSRV
jgi:hypothetical protein